MPTLEEEGTSDTTGKEKEDILRARLFPAAPEHDEEGRKQEEGEKEKISLEEVRRAYRNMGGQKAPGEDKIVVKAIKETMECLREWIRQLYESALNNGRQPREWKGAIAAIIPKPGKSDYTKVKSYRPVSLLNTLGKGLEKIVAGRLAERGEQDRKEGLHVQQWGGVRGRSAEECVEATLEWATRKETKGKRSS